MQNSIFCVNSHSGLPVRCLKFSYHMGGDWQYGKFTVRIVSPGSNQAITTIVTVTKQEQSRVSLLNGWKRETKEISHNVDYQVW